jgi:hypothetical protein
VLIADTPDFGPLLCLDYLANLAASDTEAYTHGVMNLPHENYAVSKNHPRLKRSV